MPMTLDGTSGMTAPQGAVYNGLQMASAQSSSSGTTVDFSGIPLWTQRLTVMFNNVSTSGNDDILVQIGSGSFTTSGYVSASTFMAPAGIGVVGSTSGFVLYGTDASRIVSGSMVITQITSNVWVSSHATIVSSSRTITGGGGVTLPGSLDRVRITPSGSNTFDAGTINVMYE